MVTRVTHPWIHRVSYNMLPLFAIVIDVRTIHAANMHSGLHSSLDTVAHIAHAAHVMCCSPSLRSITPDPTQPTRLTVKTRSVTIIAY